MTETESRIVFDQERASSYDEQFTKLLPFKDAFHLGMRLVLSDLPADARILCVGVGTGAELLYLAREFPGWNFTAIEPAAPMLDICRQRAQESGVASRCTFHNGYVETLPDTGAFDAATSVLVSHFFMDPDERRDFFQQIAERLRPGGYLVSADLASDMSRIEFKGLLELWRRMMAYSDLPAEKAGEYLDALGKQAAVLPPQEVGSLIASSGFREPVLFLQTLMIHAWYARRA